MEDGDVRQMLQEDYDFRVTEKSGAGVLNTPYGRVRVYFKSDLIGFQLLDYEVQSKKDTWYGFYRWKFNFHRGRENTLAAVKEHVDQFYTERDKGFPKPSELKTPPVSLRQLLRLHLTQGKGDMAEFIPYRTTRIPYGYCVWLDRNDGVQGKLPEWFKEIDKVARQHDCVGISFSTDVRPDLRFPVYE